MKQFLVIFINALFILQLSAAPTILWRQLDTGQIKIQVLNWEKESPPQLEVVTLNSKKKRYLLPTLQSMQVKGAYQLKSWKPTELPEALYKLVFKGEEVDLKAPLLASKGTFQSVKGELNHKNQKVSWKQSTPGVSRLLFQMPSGLTLASPKNWVAYSPGKHEVDWQSLNKALGSYRYQPSLIATIQIASFARDILVIGSPNVTNLGLPQTSLDCSITLTQSEKSHKNLLKVTLSKEAIQSIGTKRFEILLYVDGLFVHEESQGVSPYTYVLPEAVAESKSTLTVNVIDYAGNWGVATIEMGEGRK